MPLSYVVAGAGGFALGIFLHTFLNFSAAFNLGALIVSLMVGWWGYFQNSPFLRRSAFLCAIAGLALIIGIVRFGFAESAFDHSALANQLNTSVTIEGVVVREPDVRAATQHLYVEVGDELLLITTDPYLPIAYGDVVAIEGELRTPEAFVTDLGRSFNYPGYLLARGVAYRITFADVTVLRLGEGSFLYTTLFSIKARFISALATVLPEPQFGLGVGLLLGVKQALGESLETAFRETGIIHIVVLSGYNVMLVVAFVMYVFSYFLPLTARVTTGLVAITIFALLVGLSATVVRATIMAALFLVAHALGRTYDMLRALLCAGVVMLFVNPYLLAYDVGFQLSFLATLGLVLVAPQFESLLVRVPARIGVSEFVIATMATQVAVLPLLLYQIGELSLVAVFVNVLVLPMVPVAMLLTFATGLLAIVSPLLATVTVYPTYAALSYIIEVALWWATLPFAAVAVPVFPFYVVPIAYALLGWGLWYFSQLRYQALSTPTLIDWTIVEEQRHEGTKNAAARSAAATEPPIFFR